MLLEQFEKEKGELSLGGPEAVFKRAAELSKENPDGPYFMGRKGTLYKTTFTSSTIENNH